MFKCGLALRKSAEKYNETLVVRDFGFWVIFILMSAEKNNSENIHKCPPSPVTPADFGKVLVVTLVTVDITFWARILQESCFL